MFNLIKDKIRFSGIKEIYDLLDEYETAVFPPVVTIYLHTENADVKYHFTLEGLNVCDGEVGIWVTYSKDRTEQGRIHKQIDWVNINDLENNKGSIITHIAGAINNWLKETNNG